MFTVTFYHCAHLASNKIYKFIRLTSYIVVVADKIGHRITLSNLDNIRTHPMFTRNPSSIPIYAYSHDPPNRKIRPNNVQANIKRIAATLSKAF